MSLIVIIALDIFVVYMIFAGLHDHTTLLTSPYEYMPPACREAIVENSWIHDKKLDKLQALLLSPENAYRYNSRSYLDSSEIEKSHPSCNQFLSKINLVKKNHEIIDAFRKRKTVQENQQQIDKQFKQSKDVYDTNLLENIASETESSNVDSISEKSKHLSKELNKLNKALTEYEHIILTNKSFIEFSQFLDELRTKKDLVISDLRKFDFWYPIKVLAWQLVFLIPLCALFYFWNARSINKSNSLQILISSHLLVVSFIPIFIRILDLILDILPHRLLESLFKILKSLNIIAIWHYLIIFLAVIFALLAIYVIQKKVFSQEKIIQKRLIKGSCYKCGKKLPLQSAICPFCGTKQETQCSICQKNTYIAGPFCINCGSPRKK